MAELQEPLKVGQAAPNFLLQAHGGGEGGLINLLGHWGVVVFYLHDGNESCAHELKSFGDLQAEFESLGIKVMAIGVEPADSHARFAAELGVKFPLLSDAGGKTFAQYGALRNDLQPSGATAFSLSRSTYLISPDMRIAKSYHDVASVNHAAEVLADAKELIGQDPVRQVISQAPVLLVPNVLPPELCKELMDLWETEHIDSGFMKQIEGKTVGLVDHKHKIRSDHFIAPGPLQARVQGFVGQRIVPEMRKAFNYTVTRREDFRIACYDSASGGYFRPHRDNTTDGTAHRRFAMSLLLNDEYGGGYLRFPEFGPHQYRPGAGAAVIFSCSLLHEATDVTAGRRFVLLSFFYGDAEAKIREEYNRRTGGAYRA